MRHGKGFTLIELLVVVAIIAMLASVILTSLGSARAKARDVKRLAEMRTMQTALELYHSTFGVYPSSDGAGTGGWDTPGNGTFIAPLVVNGFIPAHILDPLTNDSGGNYKYYRYPAGTSDCTGTAFYVIEIVDLETSSGVSAASPGWRCTGRNWQNEAEWVTGMHE